MTRTGLALALLLCLPPVVNAQATAPTSVVEIRTSAQSTVDLPAAGASLVVNFSVRGRTPGEAGRSNAARATAIRRALRSLGIPDDSITTRGYSSALRTDGYQRDTHFVASNAVLVRTSQLALIPRVIDTVLAEGATNVADLRFWARGAEEARLEAIGDATRRARQQADALARAAGGRVGRLLELSTDPPRDRDAYAFGRLSGVVVTGVSDDPTPIQAPAVSVAVSVYTRWEFVPDSR